MAVLALGALARSVCGAPNEIMRNLFDPKGDLKFSRARIGMNSNDYGRSWWRCDEVPGDFELRYSHSFSTFITSIKPNLT